MECLMVDVLDKGLAVQLVDAKVDVSDEMLVAQQVDAKAALSADPLVVMTENKLVDLMAA